MTNSTSNLQFASLVVHEAKIHDVVYDDIGPKTTRKWHWDLTKMFISIPWLKTWQCCGTRRLPCLMCIKMRHSSCMQCHFVSKWDFQAYENFSGYSVKGHHAWPIFEEDISYVQLKHGRRNVYTRHRHFLKAYHPYQWLKKYFNGIQEHESGLISLTGP